MKEVQADLGALEIEKGKYKYTVKYTCDEKFIKGFEYADRV